MSEQESAILELIKRGLFAIDEQGHIWRTGVLTRSGRLISTTKSSAERIRADGYVRVHASSGGRDISALVHRLVWTHANGPIPDGLEINHKNGRRADNRISNLEVVTKSENLAHAYKQLGRVRAAGERNGRHKLTTDQVVVIRQRLAEGATCRGLAREHGVTHRVICLIRDGKFWRDQYPEVVHG